MRRRHTGIVMWQSVRALVFDPGQPHGFNAEFLQNLMAEGAGTVIGIGVSVMIAIHLDRQREKSRYRDQRGRAVTRWVKNHTDMVDNLRASFRQADTADEREMRVLIVSNALRDARDIRDDYASALEGAQLGETFEAYVRALNTLSAGLADLHVTHETVEERYVATTEALKALVQKAGARRAVLQTEPVFGEIRLRIPLHHQETEKKETALTAGQAPASGARTMRRGTPTRRRYFQ